MPAGDMILNPSDPLPSSQAYIALHYKFNGTRTLHHHNGDFHIWRGTHYAIAEESTIRAEIYAFLEKAKRVVPKAETPVPFQPNIARVNNVVDALRAVSNLSGDYRPPAWLDAADHPVATEILACANGLLHLPTLTLLPPTPTFFSPVAVRFAYASDAPLPTQWLNFLDSIFPNDPEAIATLGEIFGYVLTGDTRQQKIFGAIGPKRCGKGTIARILTALLGQDNIAGPTLASLGQNFGLSPLIGKHLAIIADARLGRGNDGAAIAERLLSISGEDSLTVDRKYREPWTGQLSTRFLILSNEIPRFSDASGALSSRFVLLTMRTSFYRREDQGLTDKLKTELPGILNWAITGWQRLTARGYFLQPASSSEAIEELESLASPVLAFIRERCAIGPGYQCRIDSVYLAWKSWCLERGRDHAGTQQTFGRDLRAAVPGLTVTQHHKVRHYEGIAISPTDAR